MRTITDHKSNELNEAIEIVAADQPGSGGANHDYVVSFPRTLPGGSKEMAGIRLTFQNGPIGEVGVNGLSNETLLAIVIDRLRGFQGELPHQQGDARSLVARPIFAPFRCRENANALTRIEEALMWLHKRTQNRTTRRVEGTHKP